MKSKGILDRIIWPTPFLKINNKKNHKHYKKLNI